MFVAAPAQPARYHRRRIEGDALRQHVEALEGEVVRVGVGQQQCIELGQVRQWNSRRIYARKKPAERRVKVRVGQDGCAAQPN